jgi:hypothetical protein
VVYHSIKFCFQVLLSNLNCFPLFLSSVDIWWVLPLTFQRCIEECLCMKKTEVYRRYCGDLLKNPLRSMNSLQSHTGLLLRHS